HGGADAVGAGVAAADDHHVLVLGRDEIAVFVAVEEAAGVGGQELHGQVDTLEIAAFDGQVAGFGGAGAKNHRVEIFQEFVRRVIRNGPLTPALSPSEGERGMANRGVSDEGDTLCFHLLNAAQDYGFFVQLHVGNAVHQQAADAVVALENG